MLKVKPHPDYPPEEGRYLRSNDNSPAAVAIILNCDADKIPPELENLVKFRGYSLYDIGAYPEEPLSGKITWRVTMPWAQPADEKEEEALKKAKELLEKLRAKNQKLN